MILIAQLVKNTPAMQETPVRFLGREDSPGEGKGYPLQYSGLENSMDCLVHRVTKSRTVTFTFTFLLTSVEIPTPYLGVPSPRSWPLLRPVLSSPIMFVGIAGTLGFLFFLEHIKLVFTSGPSYQLFPLPGMLFHPITACLFLLF